MRYFLIMKYSISIKHSKNLNWKIANNLFKTITDALFVIHTHKSADIVMQDGVIFNIKDIVVTDKNIIHNLRIDLDSPVKKEKKDVKLSLWDKYLSNITKMYSESKFDKSLLSSINKDDNEENETFEIFNNNDDYD